MGNKDCNEVIEEKNATLNQFERNKFFYGKLMTVRDFELEQNYFNGKRHLLNRLIHGVGLVCGLEVENPNPKGNTLEIDLTSGAALDCWGREIVVDKTYEDLEVKGTFDNTKLNYLYLKQKPCLKDPVPVLANASTCEQECCYSRIRENFEVVLSQEKPEDKIKLSSDKLVDNAQSYFDEYLEECPKCECDDPKVLLAVVKKTDSDIEVDEPETRKYRSIVYNNPMLYDLLRSHTTDEGSHISNTDRDKWNSAIRKVNDIRPVAETGNFTIKAKAGGNITITPDAQTSSITISSTGGLYLEYPDGKVLTLEGKASARVEHNFKRYPVVDIYEYYVEGDVYSLVTLEDLGLIATLTGKSTSVVETEMGADSLNKFARKIEVSIRRDARLTTAVNKLNATATLRERPLILSDRASTLLNNPVLEVLDNVRVISKIAYLRKTVDSEGRSGPPIEVRHETKNTVKVINNSNESVRIKIILTA